VSYGFPIINFRNLGVHYETPCIGNAIKLDHIVRLKYNKSGLKKMPVKDSRRSSLGGRTITSDADRMPVTPEGGVMEL
jgi:hypothetical protein